MKNIFCFLVLLYLTLCASIFGQNSFNKIVTSKNLPQDVTWKQLLSNKNSDFAVGFRNTEAVLYNLKSDVSIIISKIGQRRFSFSLGDDICFGFLGACSDSNPSEVEIMVFELNARLKKTLNISCNGNIINYIVDSDEQNVFFTTIDFDEYMSGKTNGTLNCSLNKAQDLNQVLKFSYKQPLPPNRISLPVISKKDDIIYVAFEDKYYIDIYSSGKKINSFTLPNFQAKPYSSEEIKVLSPIQKSIIQEGISYPPVIKKIEINEKGFIFVTRYPRPGDTKIFVDVFEAKGKYVRTYEFFINENEQFIDGCLTLENDYIILHSSDNAEYSIKIFKLY